MDIGTLKYLMVTWIYCSLLVLLALVHIGSGAHTGSFPVGTGGSYLVGKAVGCDADNLSPSSFDVKNAWSYTSTSQIRLHGVVLS
jgi:hypothetical protein